MNRPFLLLIFAVFLAFGCNSDSENNQGREDDDANSVPAALTPIDTNYHNDKLLMSPELSWKVLFNGGDSVVIPGTDKMAIQKDKNDFMAYLPVEGSSEHGWLWTNHEVIDAHDELGDGGGATLMELKLENGEWNVIGKPYSVDFSAVKGTYNNCLGGVTPDGRVLTSEEYEPWSNKEIFKNGKGIRDTSDYNGYPAYMNYGWMVEVDPVSKKAIRKLWSLGRFSHEGVLCMENGKTVYLMDDDGPGLFFKFVADEAGDYTQGQLYAYQQSDDLQSGEWLPLPMERDSLNYARDVALRRGATIFIRLEDIEILPDGRLIMTETGLDRVDLSRAVGLGGTVAKHLEPHHTGDHVYSDYFGRFLVFDIESNKLEVFMECGPAEADKSIVISNPDNISVNMARKLLVVHEDMNATSGGRVPAATEGWLTNEIWALDLNIANPKPDDFVRIGVAPKGAETTGPTWTPDFKSFFFNVQHPDAGNPAPFERSATVSVRGF